MIVGSASALMAASASSGLASPRLRLRKAGHLRAVLALLRVPSAMPSRRAAIEETLRGAPEPQRRPPPQQQHTRRPLVLLLLLALVLMACRPLARRWRVVHLGTISTCLPDALTGASPPQPAAAGADRERYLFYSPQFGHSNQLVALRNAAAWAAVLNRTLVLPHLLGHATEREYEAGTPVRRPMATYAAAFDIARARTAAPLRVIEVDAFLKLGLFPLQLVQLEHVAVLKLVAARDDYFEQLGLGWASQRLDVPMTSFTPDSIRAAFGGCVAASAPPLPPSSARRGSNPACPPFACRRPRAWRGSCGHHQVLAFRSLFAAWDPRPGGPNPPGWQVGGMPGLSWLDGLAAPALLAPSAGVARLVDALVGELTRPPTAAGSASASASASAPTRRERELVCVHVRRGDFERDCPRYAAEAAGRRPRPWVRAHFADGWSCLQGEAELAHNLHLLASTAPHAAPTRRDTGAPLAFFAAVEDPTHVAFPALRPFGLSPLAAFSSTVRAHALPMPDAIAATILDQQVCSHARHFVLNIFSTFSQLVMGLIGLRHPRIGYVRDLTPQQQRTLGVNVTFWRQLSSNGAG